jgi:acyl carrier protein
MIEITMENVKETLINEVAAILSVDPKTIAPDAPLYALKIDSLKFVELLVVIEKTYNLKLLESPLSRDDFQSIRSLASSIARLLSAR